MADSSGASTHNQPNPWPELDEVLRARTLLLTTYRKSGEPVATPVWAANINGRYYFTTPSSTAKVKRLARNDRVGVACGDPRGRPIAGPSFAARALTVDDVGLLVPFRAAMRKKGPFMSRVIETMYLVKKDQRLLYELVRPVD